MKIRAINQKDNKQVALLVRSVLEELDVPKIGTAYADSELDSMFEAYNKPKHAYFVVETEGKIVGCAGIAPLANASVEICELQKMYFLPQARGLGLGAHMMDICLTQARKLGFEKCYLETMPYMEAAQKLYKKSGFDYLKEPLGCTGHSSCPVWMIKQL